MWRNADGGSAKGMTPTVSVIVVNFNRRDLMAQCLASLDAQTFRDFEIIVVDNGSSDGSVDALRRRFNRSTAPVLHVVELPNNVGFSGGCNAGIAIARGKYIATLNNDAEADPGWLSALVDAIEGDDRVGMCASKILFHGDRTRIDKAGHLIYLDGLNHGRGSGERDQGQYEILEETLFPDGAAALYRLSMLEETGPFDEAFFAYGDDADLGLRGRLAGWTCVYAPAAIAYHMRSATAGEFSSLKAFLIERNRVFVAVKTFPLALLLVSPFFTAARFAFHAYGAIFSIGSSGRFAAGASRAGLAVAIVRAYISALGYLPQMWRSRRAIRRSVRLSDRAFVSMLWKRRIALRALTLGT
jgi:GT2 family glycosyltransferase